MLNPNLAATLTKIAEATRVPPHYLMQNQKGPLVRALEKDGLISRSPGVTDPSNADSVGFIATNEGFAALGYAPAGQAAPVAQPVQSAPPVINPPVINPPVVGASPVSETAYVNTAAPKVKKARAPSVPPVVQYSGARFGSLPVGVARTRSGGTKSSPYRFSQLAAPDASGFDTFFVQKTAEMPDPFKVVRASVNAANKRMAPIAFKAIEVADDLEFRVAGVRVARIA